MFVDHYVIFASIGRPFQIFVPQKAHDNGRQKSQKVKNSKIRFQQVVWNVNLHNISKSEVIWIKVVG